MTDVKDWRIIMVLSLGAKKSSAVVPRSNSSLAALFAINAKLINGAQLSSAWNLAMRLLEVAIKAIK